MSISSVSSALQSAMPAISPSGPGSTASATPAPRTFGDIKDTVSLSPAAQERMAADEPDNDSDDR